MSDMYESGFVVREQAWHGKAKVLETPPKTGQEAMIEAGCDWTVEKRPLYLLPSAVTISEEDGGGIAYPTDETTSLDEDNIELMDASQAPAYATVRQTDGRILGVVGERYRVLQNAQAFSWFDPLLEAGDLEFETGGSILSGSRVFVEAKITGVQADIVPGDTVLPYLLLTNSHDGMFPVDIRFTPVRVVCHNTLTAALADQDNPHLTIRHTESCERTLAVIRQTIETAKRAFTVSAEQYAYLASQQVEGLERVYLRRLFNHPDDKPTKAEDAILRCIESGKGQDLIGVRGTWWAAFNGVAEWIQYERGRVATRVAQSLYGAGNDLREYAFKLAMQMSGNEGD